MTFTARSDCVFASAEAVAELLPGAGSGGTDCTEAVSLIVVSQGTFEFSLTTSAKFADPFASVATLQVIVPVPPTAGVVQVQPAGEVSDWNVVFAGMALVRVTDDADVAAVPLVTVMLNVVLAPAMGDCEVELVTDRSATPPIVPTLVLPVAVCVFVGKPGKFPTTVAE